MEFPILTPRTRLRRLTPADLPDFQRYRHDTEVGRYQSWLPQSDAEATAFLAASATAEFFEPGVWFQIGMADLETDRLIGDIGICLAVALPEAEIGFTVCRESQGRGLGREAVAAMVAFIFCETCVNRIVANTDARNSASINLLEKLGMQRLHTSEALFRGLPCEEHLYALDRPVA